MEFKNHMSIKICWFKYLLECQKKTQLEIFVTKFQLQLNCQQQTNELQNNKKQKNLQNWSQHSVMHRHSLLYKPLMMKNKMLPIDV